MVQPATSWFSQWTRPISLRFGSNQMKEHASSDCSSVRQQWMLRWGRRWNWILKRQVGFFAMDGFWEHLIIFRDCHPKKCMCKFIHEPQEAATVDGSQNWDIQVGMIQCLQTRYSIITLIIPTAVKFCSSTVAYGWLEFAEVVDPFWTHYHILSSSCSSFSPGQMFGDCVSTHGSKFQHMTIPQHIVHGIVFSRMVSTSITKYPQPAWRKDKSQRFCLLYLGS